MRRFALLSVFLGLLLFAQEDEEKPPKTVGQELVKNGDFEAGKDVPEGWDEPDDLTVFWVKSPTGKGKCLKFDSDVLLSDLKRRWKEMKLPKDKRPPAKMSHRPTEKEQYDTVAATYGAQIWSHYFPLEHGKKYLFRLRYFSKGPKMKAFVKGYAEIDGEKREVYRAHLPCNPEKEELNNWKEFWMVFKVRHPSYKIKWGRVHLLVYWPRGEAFVDDVSVRRVADTTPSESEKALKQKKKVYGEDKKK